MTVLPFGRFAYPELHLAFETAEGVIAAHLAYLVFGRFRTTGQLRHLALTAAFATMAAVNLMLGALRIVSLSTPRQEFCRWAALGMRLVAITTLCLAGFAGSRLAPQGRALLVFVAKTALGVLATVRLLAWAADLFLTQAVAPSLSPESSERPRIVGHPAVLAVQVVALVLFAVAPSSSPRRPKRSPTTS